jgi:hypothetical protein
VSVTGWPRSKQIIINILYDSLFELFFSVDLPVGTTLTLYVFLGQKATIQHPLAAKRILFPHTEILRKFHFSEEINFDF